jgi:hypothetical protein
MRSRSSWKHLKVSRPRRWRPTPPNSGVELSAFFPMSAMTCDLGDSGDHRGPQIGPFLPGWGGIWVRLSISAITNFGNIGNFLPSPLASIRIPKALTKVIPRHPNLAWVSEESCGTAALGGGLSGHARFRRSPGPPDRAVFARLGWDLG